MLIAVEPNVQTTFQGRHPGIHDPESDDRNRHGEAYEKTVRASARSKPVWFRSSRHSRGSLATNMTARTGAGRRSPNLCPHGRNLVPLPYPARGWALAAPPPRDCAQSLANPDRAQKGPDLGHTALVVVACCSQPPRSSPPHYSTPPSRGPFAAVPHHQPRTRGRISSAHRHLPGLAPREPPS